MDQLKKMREADPTDPDIAYMIAQEHVTQGEHERSLAEFDESIRLDPHYHYAFFHKARSLVVLGREDDAIGVLREALKRSRSAGDAKATNEIEAFLGELGSS